MGRVACALAGLSLSLVLAAGCTKGDDPVGVDAGDVEKTSDSGGLGDADAGAVRPDAGAFLDGGGPDAATEPVADAAVSPPDAADLVPDAAMTERDAGAAPDAAVFSPDAGPPFDPTMLPSDCPDAFACPSGDWEWPCRRGLDGETMTCHGRATYTRNADGTGTCALVVEQPFASEPECTGVGGSAPELAYWLTGADALCPPTAHAMTYPGLHTLCWFDASAMPPGARFVQQRCEGFIYHSNEARFAFTFWCPTMRRCVHPPSACYAPLGTETATGECRYDFADGVACDDGDPTTTADACSRGVCAGTLAPRGTWQPLIGTGAAPSARSEHAMVWTGTEVLVWGGYAFNVGARTMRWLGDGARLDPRTGIWRALPMTDAPAPRARATVVWTGRELMVWGGSDGAGPRNDGARFDPATDTWRPIPTAGAPSARYGAAGVWTGTELIVIGGMNRVGPVAGGARFDPAHDAWVPLPMAGAPTAAQGGAAVWTGTEMLVHAGPGGDARFDPAAGIWRAMPSAGLTGDYRARAVWTGTEMIVWQVEPSASQVGARFDPRTDRWTPLPVHDAPSLSSLAEMVWTGTDAVVWGEEDVTPGARFDPVTNLWTPLPALDRPLSRSDHGLVWTGSAVLVWGGWGVVVSRPSYTEYGPLDSGAFYYP